MKRTLIGLTEPQRERLRREASRRGTSVAALVRDAVDRAYPDDLERRREAHERAWEAIGRFHSGLHDVSERHDDYLAEAYLEHLEQARR